jgi:Tubulin like
MAMTPGLFIGIGGTGLKTVTRLKVKIYNQYILAGATKDDFERENHFIFIDTDDNDKNALQSDPIVRKGYPDLLIKNDEFINMGETNPYAIYTLDKEKKNLLPKPKRMMEWVVPQGKGNFILRNQKLSKGAGAERNVGRFGTYSCYEEICQNINAGISKLNLYLGKQNITPPNDSDDDDKKMAYKKRVADSQAPIWVFASANGGTGSSSLLDILSLLSD